MYSVYSSRICIINGCSEGALTLAAELSLRRLMSQKTIIIIVLRLLWFLLLSSFSDNDRTKKFTIRHCLHPLLTYSVRLALASGVVAPGFNFHTTRKILSSSNNHAMSRMQYNQWRPSLGGAQACWQTLNQAKKSSCNITWDVLICFWPHGLYSWREFNFNLDSVCKTSNLNVLWNNRTDTQNCVLLSLFIESWKIWPKLIETSSRIRWLKSLHRN